MVKYADNAWHALKVGFANEIGNLCKALGHRQPRGDGDLLPGHQAQPLALLPEAGLRLRRLVPAEGRARAAATRRSRSTSSCRSSNSILPSNQRQIERGVQAVIEQGQARRSASSASSFKAGTDDLRESPMVELIERLHRQGLRPALYDRNVSLAALHGANRDYILNHIPHISRLMVDASTRCSTHAEIVVDRQRAAEFRDVPDALRPGPDGDRLRARRGQRPQRAGALRRHLLVSRCSAGSSSSSRTCPCPFDRRVWQEATTLRDAGYMVSHHLPDRQGCEEQLRGASTASHICRYPLPVEADGALRLRRSSTARRCSGRSCSPAGAASRAAST